MIIIVVNIILSLHVGSAIILLILVNEELYSN